MKMQPRFKIQYPMKNQGKYNLPGAACPGYPCNIYSDFNNLISVMLQKQATRQLPGIGGVRSYALPDVLPV